MELVNQSLAHDLDLRRGITPPIMQRLQPGTMRKGLVNGSNSTEMSLRPGRARVEPIFSIWKPRLQIFKSWPGASLSAVACFPVLLLTGPHRSVTI